MSPQFVCGFLLTVLGGYVRFRCYRELGHLFTFEMSIRKDHRLITIGPYSIVRHPGYAGVLFTMGGVVLCNVSTVSVFYQGDVS
jgi:protein-S-isoprenylcysteine O-methyltransferase Ste14